MIIFPGDVEQKLNFQMGEGDPFCELILENPEWMGIIGKNLSRGEGMDISGTVHLKYAVLTVSISCVF